MAIARRLYLYAIAGITLAGLTWALITLINLALQMMFGRGDPLFGSPDSYVRGQLSLVLATIAVVLPVWAIHWAIAERSLGPATAASPERRSAVRSLYLTIVLLGFLGVLVGSGTQVVGNVLVVLLGGALPGTIAVLSPIGALLVAGAFWLYHAWVRLRDLGTEMSGAAAWLPRAYRYVAMLIGLFTLLYGIVQLVGLAGDALELTGGRVLVGSVARPLALAGVYQSIVIGFVLWFAHWAYSVRLLESRDWRGRAERTSRTRAGYFVVLVLVGAGTFIFQLSTALATVLRFALDTTGELTADEVIRSVIGGVVIGLVFAGVWWTHRVTMIGERRQFGADAQASARRVDAYAVMLIALSSGASAIAWLLGLAIDVLGRGGRTLGGAPAWQVELATFLSYALVAGIAWLLVLRQVQRWRGIDEATEARSTARRAYLLLAIGGSLLGAVSALVVILNRFIGSLIGANVSRSLASELSTPLGVVVVAILVAGLHYWWLRHDQRSVARAAPAVSAEVPLEPQAAPARVQMLALTVPPGGDAGGAVSRLRAALPEGYRLEEAD